jgi:hypothetical protein
MEALGGERSSSVATGERPRRMDDPVFFRQLRQLKKTRDFLLRQGVAARYEGDVTESPFSLGRLNLIRYFPGSGPAGVADWDALEEKQARLQELFSEELQAKYRLGSLKVGLVSVPVVLLAFIWVAIAISSFVPNSALPVREWKLVGFFFWTAALGALGAIASLAVNAFSGQDGAAYDLSDRGLVGLRVIFGAFFGSAVSLAFCVPYFLDFVEYLTSNSVTAAKTAAQGSGSTGFIILVPFLFGFGASVGMSILNRLNSGVEAVFGLGGRGGPPMRSRSTKSELH